MYVGGNRLAFRNKSALITFFWMTVFLLSATAFSLAISAASVAANVLINEVMPSPSKVDWDLSGTASSSDEWIELYNNGSQEVNLSGWRLNDTQGTTTNFLIPNDYPLLQPNDFTVFYKAKVGSTFATQITLDNAGDTIRLYDDDSVLADTLSYGKNPGTDVAFGRIMDGASDFDNLTYPTPGTENGHCTVPRDDLYLVTNTLLCNGTYELSDLASNGILVVFADNLTLDFNQASIIGDGSGIGISLVDNSLQKTSSKDVTIANANIQNYYLGIAGINTTNIYLHDVLINFIGIGIEMQNSNLTYIQDSYILNSFEEGISGFNTQDLTLDRVTLDGNANSLVLNYSSNALVLDSKFTSSLESDILLKDKTNLFILNTSASSLNFSDNSDSNATINHYFVATVQDNEGVLSSVSVSAEDKFGNLALLDTTDGLGRTSDGTVFTDYLQNRTNKISSNNYTFTILSPQPKHLQLQDSRNIDHSGEYIFVLSLEQVKPSIQITSPSNNAIVKGFVDVNVSAADNAALSNVSFYVDNALKQTNYSNQTTGMFSFRWDSSEANDSNYTLKTVVYDSAGNSNSTEINVQVNNVNSAPGFTTMTFPQTIPEDQTFSTVLTFSDSDPGDVLTFSYNTSIGQLNSSTGAFTFTPNNSQVGIHNVKFTATDTGNLSTSIQVSFNVTNTNDAPVITSTAITSATEDTVYSYDIDASDDDLGDSSSLVFSLSANPTGMSINSSTGLIIWTPTNSQVGLNTVKVRVNDSSNAIAEQQFTISVANTNDAPSINTIGTNNIIEAVEDSQSVFSITVNDDDVVNQEDIQYFVNDTRFTITKINNTLANVTFLPTNNEVGKFAVRFSVNDSGNVSASLNVIVNVSNSNDAPILNTIGTNNVVQAVEDSLVAFTLTANDDDLLHGNSVGESLSYTANDTRFSIVKINNSLANVNFMPTNDDVPIVNVKFTVTDKSNATSAQMVQVNVTNTNDAPQITAFYPVFDNPKISELGLQMFNITASDVDLNDNLAFTWEARDSNNNSFNSLLSVDTSNNRTANFTANETIGSFTVKVTVKDSKNVTATKTWTLTVADKPVASSFDTSLTTNFSAIANLSDVANVTLGKSATLVIGQPSQVLGLVSFKQNLDLSDVVDLDNLVNISKGFVRIDSKQLPQLNKSAKLIMQALDFKSAPLLKVDLEDGNGFVNCPETLCTNVSYDVNLTKDGSGTLSFEVAHFTSYLASPNTTNVAPVIVSAPVLTGKERSQYTYNVVAVDPNNDTLTYSLLAVPNSSVIPSGMSINNATGSIKWLPELGQNGTYGITLRVSDGNLSADQSYNLTISAASRLSITEIKLKIDDEDGDKKDTLVDGAKSRDIKPGQNVEVTVKIENLFTNSDFEINDVDVEGVIKNIDDDDDIDDEDENIDIDAGDEEKARLNFEIPVYADKGEYKLMITASGRGSDGIDYQDNATVFLVVEKKKHELAITKALLSPPKLNCADSTVLQVVVNNLGKDQEDDGLLVIENSLLNLSISEKLDLEEGTGDSDDESIYSKFYPIKVSKDVEAGTYDIKLSTYYDKTHLSKEKSVQLVVEDCLENKEAEKQQSVLEKPSESEDEIVVIEKSAEEILALIPEVSAFDTTPEEAVDTSFQTTLIIIALILLTGMGILIVGAFVIRKN